MRSISRFLLIGAASLCAVTLLAAPPPFYPDTIGSAINVGRDSLFSVLTVSDFNQLDDTITGPSYVKGNIGVGGHAKFSMSDGTVDGDLYLHSGSSYSLSGPARINGMIHDGNFGSMNFDATADSKIDGALMDMVGLSYWAAHDSSAGSYAVTMGNFNGMTENGNKSVTLNGTGKIVLNLQDFVMTSGTFTLQGTATTTYIINVARNFSLNNSKIVLSGVPPANVLFNILGTGSQVSLNQGTQMSGILLAYQRKVDLSGGKVFGKVIGNQVNITSGGQVVSQ